MSSFSERDALGKQFAGDVARMLQCLRAAGKQVTRDDIIYAWADYSDGLCAGWLMPPEDDAILLTILLRHLPASPLTWQTTLQDAGDGSGGQVLVLPNELLEQMGWKEGDRLTIARYASEELILRRTT